MHVQRQNFGCTIMKNNPDKKSHSTEYMKIIVVGGWTGKH